MSVPYILHLNGVFQHLFSFHFVLIYLRFVPSLILLALAALQKIKIKNEEKKKGKNKNILSKKKVQFSLKEKADHL